MIWKTPGGLAFAASISSSLSRGKNAVVMLPRTLPKASLIRRVSRDLHNDGKKVPKVFDLATAAPPDADGLVPILRDAWDWNDESRKPHFGDRPELPDLFRALWEDRNLKFLALTGLETLPPQAQQAVAEGVSEWAGLSQDASNPSPQGLRLAVFVPPSFREIRSDLFLTRHVFWGQIRQSDLDWAFRRSMSASRAQDSQAQAEYLYLKPMCLALCSEDFELMARIVAERPMSLEDAVDILRSYPLRKATEKMGVRPDAADTAAAARHPLLSGGLPPPRPASRHEVELWSEGLLAANGFTRLHPVMLGMNDLERAVAAAQREVFLPAVDHVQSILVTIVEMAHGPDVWSFYLQDPEQRNHVLTEISPMAYFLAQTVRPHGILNYQAKKSAQDCAFAWRQLRHAGAHNKVATFREVLTAVKRYNEFREHYERVTRLWAPAR
ncbi:MAG: hypothetical protein LBT40_17605 [Deltaproteobacteria bacterium]|jgi:hypothetical protein|nr:hypothetical protein [Deltaproteobacteria bacterium]